MRCFGLSELPLPRLNQMLLSADLIMPLSSDGPKRDSVVLVLPTR